MQKFIQALLCTVGAVLLILGMYLVTHLNIDFGTITTPILGAALLICGIFYKRLGRVTRRGIPRVLRYIFIGGLTFVFLLSSFLCIYGSRDNVTYDESAVIVLGAGLHGDKMSEALRFRMEATIQYAEKNPNALIVVSGGKGFQESVTEAYAMKKYLIQNGVDESRVIEEDRATSTYENFLYSKELLDERLGDEYSLCYITNDFHIFRAGLIAGKCEMTPTHYHAKMPISTLVPNYLRECAAVFKFLLLGY